MKGCSVDFKMASVFRQWSASLGIILLHFVYGNLYAVFSKLMTSLADEGNDVIITADQNDAIVTAVIISAAAGQFTCGFLADLIGRRKVLCASALPGVLGCLLLQSTQEYWQILIASVGIGLTVAGLALGQLYIAEISSSKHRGLLLSLTLTAAAVGNTIGVISNTTLESNWRTIISYDVVLVVIFLLTSLIIPESPVWLASKQQYVQCGKNLSWLRRDEDTSLECEEWFEKELDISPKLKNIRLKTISVCDVYCKTFVKSLFISFACFLILVVEINSKSTLFKIGADFFNQMIGSEQQFTYFFVILPVIDLTAVCLSCMLISYINRKTLLLSCGILTVLSSALFSIITYFISSGRLSTSLIFIPLSSLIIFVFFINLGLVPAVYAINREIFTLFYRGAGLSISSLGNSLVLFLVVKIFPWILKSCSLNGLFAIVSIVLLLAFSFVYCYCPETNGRTLKEIDDVFERDNGVIVIDELRIVYHTLPNDSLARGIRWGIERY